MAVVHLLSGRCLAHAAFQLSMFVLLLLSNAGMSLEANATQAAISITSLDSSSLLRQLA
jgi:hypothetical protein